MPNNSNSDISFGYVLAAGILLFTLGGYYIGLKFNHHIIGLFIGITLSVIFFGYEIWKKYQKYQ